MVLCLAWSGLVFSAVCFWFKECLNIFLLVYGGVDGCFQVIEKLRLSQMMMTNPCL